MADRRYRAGHRREDLHYGNRQFSEHRYGWVRTWLGQFVILIDRKASDGDLNVTLYHPRERGGPVTLALTECTEAELTAMRDLFNRAFDLAMETTRRRDRIADEAFQRGDDSYARSYRQVPQLVYREGTLGEHGPSVQERHESVSPSGWGGLPADDGGVRGSGDELAEHDSQESQSEDDGQETD